MINEGAVVKLAFAPAAVFIVADLLPKMVQSGLAAIAFTAAGIGGLGYLVRLSRRGLKRGRAFVARIHRGLDQLETLPRFRVEVTERLDSVDKRFDAIAEADRARIADALAGDRRTPLDRRKNT